MIALSRSRTASAIPVSLRGAKRMEKEKELLRAHRAFLQSGTKIVWKTNYWKAGKTRLKKDTQGKCAYCESPTDVVAHGDVEHFRPKSVYWWLAYCFDNHLYSCQICNQSFKGDAFPLETGASAMSGPVISATSSDASLDALVSTFAPDPFDVLDVLKLDDFLAECDTERAGLPNPYLLKATTSVFRWEADETNKEVFVRPRTASSRDQFIHVSCEQFMGLNREELRRWRWVLAFEPLRHLKEILEAMMAAGVTGTPVTLTKKSIRDMMSSDKPYSAMVQFFVNEEWALTV